jgi:hypothetical protein
MSAISVGRVKEVSDRQQIGLALGQPRARSGALAFGAVPVAAANGIFPLAALWAKSVMGSQDGIPLNPRRFWAIALSITVRS